MDTKRPLLCAALLAGMFILNEPLFGVVESATVGYTKITLEAGTWYLLGTPFAALEDGATRTLNDIFALEGFGSGDTLYRLSKDDGTFKARYWRDDGTNKGWSTSRVRWLVDDVELAPGEAVYIKKVDEGTVSFTGKVQPTAVAFGAEEGNSWSMVAPVWPEGKALNDVTWSDNLTTSDRLYRLDKTDGTFKSRYWRDDGTNKGWSTSRVRWSPDTTPLDVGEALYINKASADVGTLSI